MIVSVFSKYPMNKEEKEKIQSIMQESKCPNESLRKTFRRFSHMDGDDIFFDNGGRILRTEIVL